MNKVIVVTNLGDFTIQLNVDKAPVTVENFLQYVKDNFYNGTLFHRVVKGFVVQGGGYKPVGAQSIVETAGKRDNIICESKNGLKNTKYSVAMARTSDPKSANCQFFINTKENKFLDYPGQDGWGYAVFGEVVDGFEIVDEINNAKVHRVGMHSDVPVEPIIIRKVMLWPEKPLYDHKAGDAVRGEGEQPIGESKRSKIEFGEPEQEQAHAATPQYIPPPN